MPRAIPTNIYQSIDITPVEIPTRLRLPQSRTDQIRQFIREEMSRSAHLQGHETFDEADDLEPDDEEALPFTPYEMSDLEPPAPLQNGVAPQGAGPADPAPSKVPAGDSSAPSVDSPAPGNVPS